MPSTIGKVDSAVGYTGNAYVIDQTKDVLEAARERVRYCFDNADTYIVSFSGGKDSSCAFHLSWQEAKKRGQRLKVAMFDEEVLEPDTVAYVDYHFQKDGKVIEADVQFWMDYMKQRGDLTVDWLKPENVASNIYHP